MQRIDLSKTLAILVILISCSVPAFVFGDDSVPLPEDEAPASIFSTSIGDADVDLFLTGSWNISTSLGGIWGTESSETPSVSGFSSGFKFTQLPNLTLSLWLMERYFFETSITEDSSFNTYLLGYEGREGELVQSVRLGNIGTSIESTPLIDPGEHPAGALGASASLETEHSKHELLFRYQKTSRITKTYAGTSEIEEVRLDPADFIRGQYFLLDDENIENAAVYLENQDGGLLGDDGRSYKKASDYEAAISSEDGYVSLTSEPAGRVLIYYEKNGVPVSGDVVLSDGTDALLLYGDGEVSDYEYLAVYSDSDASSGDTVDVELRHSGELEAVATFTGEYGNGIITLTGGASDKKPLEDYIPQIYPGDPDYEPLVPYILFYEKSSGTASISVPDSAITGSVTVSINGRNETRFTRLDDGTLDFPFPIYDSDTIEVSYEIADDGASGTDILLVSTNTFTPWENIPELSLRGDIGFRWNSNDQGYSEEYDESPGSLLVAAGAEYETDKWEINLDGGFSVGTHDTLGYLRLGGMDEEALSFSISGHTLFPAAPSTSFDEDALGQMSYTDYYKYLSTGGSTLQEYDWSPPDEQVYSFADGNPIGPSIAKAEDDDIDGIVAVLDFDMDISEWVGAQISYPGDTLDLSDATAISFKYKLTGTASDLNMTLRAGSVSEDLDADGSLDEENGPYDTGFPFTYHPNNWTMYVGGGGNGSRGNYGNGTEESEDADGNELLNQETSTQVFEDTVSTLTAGTWQEVYISLSGSDREQLAATRAVQILLEASAATSGRLLIGEVRFHGSSFVPGNTESETSEVSEYDLDSDEQPSRELSSTYDLVDDRFNDGDDDQKVLRLEWSGTSGEAVGPLTEVPLDSYETLRFYYRLDSLGTDSDPTDLSLTISGDDGSYTVTLEDISVSSTWSEVSVDLSNDRVSVDGDSPTTSVSGSTNFTAQQATFTLTNSNGGVVFLDELHLSDPVLSTDLGILSSAHFTHEGKILEVNGIPLLSDFSWSGSSRVASTGFASGFIPADGRTYWFYNEANFSSLYSRAQVSLNVREEDTGPQVSGGHTLTIPEDGPLQIKDSYTHDPEEDDFSFTKQNNLNLNLSRLQLDVTSQASYDDETLTQTWITGMEIRPYDWFALTPSLNLSNSLSDSGVNFYSYYGDGWVQGTGLLIYTEGDDPTTRSTNLSVPMELQLGETYTFRIFPSADISRYGTDTRKELDTMDLGFDFSGAVFPNDFNRIDYTIYYQRDFSSKASPADTDRENGFATDFAFWADTIGDQEYFLTSVPLAEIVQNYAKSSFREATVGFDAAGYSPGAGISLERRFSSRLIDLVVPSSLSFDIGRTYTRSYDSITTSFTTATTTSMSAINLFGSLGAYSLFDWYESDQFSSSIQLSTEQDDEFDFSLSCKNEILLLGQGLSEYGLSHEVSFSSDDDRPTLNGNLSAIWFQAMDFTFTLPLGGINLPPADKHLRHGETVSWELSPVEGETWSRNMSIKHATGITFGGQGSIEVYLAFGFKHTPISGSDNLTYYALETGITGELLF